MRNSLRGRIQRVGIASHAAKFLNNVDLCKKVTETNFPSCDEGEVAEKEETQNTSSVDDFIMRMIFFLLAKKKSNLAQKGT